MSLYEYNFPVEGVINPGRRNCYDWVVEMTSTQILLVTVRKKNSSSPPFPGGLSFVHNDGKKGITQLYHMVRPCVWLENFFRGYELNATPLLYLRSPWVWISAHQVTRELYDNFKNLDVLLSTTMELLGFGGLYWMKRGGHSDGPTWKR